MIVKVIISLLVIILGLNFFGVVNLEDIIGGVEPKISYPVEVGAPILYTEAQTDNQNGYYQITGTVYNRGTATAHNAYAYIEFADEYGSVFNKYNKDLGDIASNDETSFSAEGSTDPYAKIKVKACCDEISNCY